MAKSSPSPLLTVAVACAVLYGGARLTLHLILRKMA